MNTTNNTTFGQSGQSDNNSSISTINRELQEKSTMRLAKELSLSYINISKTPINPDFFKVIDLEDSIKGNIVCFFKIGKKIRVALSDIDNPNTKEVIEKIKKQGFDIEINLASEDGISETLDKYTGTDKYKKIDIVEDIQQDKIQSYADELSELKDLPNKIASLTAEQGVNLLNIGAIKTGSSDIHYEPEENGVVVRFRIDGMLNKVFELSTATYQNLMNQIKYQAKMQINISNVPQDGRYTFTVNNKKIAVRVSSIPTPYGESIVCRFLISKEKPLTLEELGFQDLALTKLKKATKIPNGMILVTGPTGSGKTTTLYSLLNMMNTPSNKIITLEDPVEYQIKGVTQSQINEKRGYHFASGLKTILRQDPDIVMLGEIRDFDTAEAGTQAALTGHVVLSTLHTNSALDTIPRLINMGVPPFMIAPAIDTIVAQRLVRKVCPHCSQKELLTDSEKIEFEYIFNNLKKTHAGMQLQIPDGLPKINGCDKCSNTGYKGRLVISEVMNINNTMKRLIMNNASNVDLILAARRQGIITMREDGFIKVAQGFTTLSEVYRVTNIIH